MKRIVHGYLGEKASREMEPRSRIKEESSSLRVENLLGKEVMETEVGSKSNEALYADAMLKTADYLDCAR